MRLQKREIHPFRSNRRRRVAMPCYFSVTLTNFFVFDYFSYLKLVHFMFHSRAHRCVGVARRRMWKQMQMHWIALQFCINLILFVTYHLNLQGTCSKYFANCCVNARKWTSVMSCLLYLYLANVCERFLWLFNANCVFFFDGVSSVCCF